MQTSIEGGPSFAHLHVDLDPGESIIAESDAMASMAADLDMITKLNGGFFGGLCRKFLGGESLFINTFVNHTGETKRVSLVQASPGDIGQVELNGTSLCLQPGAYLCSTPGVKLGLKWAGLASFIGREGLFKLVVSGTGTVWYSAYGGLLERDVDGEYIVDSGHLVTYEPTLKLKVQLAGGIFSSFFGGEGLVTRLEGKGKIVMQTRSLSGLANWLNPRI
ncbi:MAG: TIGR00266 family protein [Verrucomicrobiota bacterium]